MQGGQSPVDDASPWQGSLALSERRKLSEPLFSHLSRAASAHAAQSHQAPAECVLFSRYGHMSIRNRLLLASLRLMALYPTKLQPRT